MRLNVVLRTPPAVLHHDAQDPMCVGVPLVGSPPVPSGRLQEILFDTAPVAVDQPEAILSNDVALLGGPLVQDPRNGVMCSLGAASSSSR